VCARAIVRRAARNGRGRGGVRRLGGGSGDSVLSRCPRASTHYLPPTERRARRVFECGSACLASESSRASIERETADGLTAEPMLHETKCVCVLYSSFTNRGDNNNIIIIVYFNKYYYLYCKTVRDGESLPADWVATMRESDKANWVILWFMVYWCGVVSYYITI